MLLLKKIVLHANKDGALDQELRSQRHLVAIEDSPEDSPVSIVGILAQFCDSPACKEDGK